MAVLDTPVLEGRAMRDIALDYLALGWVVVPGHAINHLTGRCTCGKATCKGKHPRVRSWKQHTETTVRHIRRWWQRNPDANLGVLTGQSGLVVLDFDGNQGYATLLALREEDLPIDTATVRTGSGGQHLYFLAPEGTPILTRTGVLPGMDVRAQGGYAVLPPSTHPSGRQYAWEKHPDDFPPFPLPEWLAERLRQGKPSGTSKSEQESQDSSQTQAASHSEMTLSATPLVMGHISADDLRAFARTPEYVIRVAQLLGIPDPERAVRERRNFCCVIPGHEEESPSCAIFRKDDGIYVYMDFHRGEQALSLATVYRARLTGKLPETKISKEENAAYSVRLLLDTETVAPYPIAWQSLPSKASKIDKQVYAGLQRYFGGAWLYMPPGTAMPFSQRFGAAWCGGMRGGEFSVAIKNLLRWAVIDRPMVKQIRGLMTPCYIPMEV